MIESGFSRLIKECGITDFKQIGNIRQTFDEYEVDFDEQMKSIYPNIRHTIYATSGKKPVQLTFGYIAESETRIDDFILFRLSKQMQRLSNQYAPIFDDVFNPLK